MKTTLLFSVVCVLGLARVQAQISFTDLSYPLPGNKPNCIAVKSNGHIFVGSDSAKVLRSTDGGATFTKTYVMANQGSFNKVYEICETAAGTMLGYATAGRIFRSTDSGNSWTVINAALGSGGPFYMSVQSNTVYVHEGSRIKQSTDDGLTWSNWGTQAGTYVDFDNGGKAYIAGQATGGLFTSTDGNVTSTNVAGTSGLNINKVLVTPDQYVHIYRGNTDYYSSATGAAFVQHTPSGMSSLSDMIHYGNTIIIGAGGASGPGIQYTTDQGTTFQNITAAMGTFNYISFYNFMAVDNNGVLYVIAEDNSGTKKLMKTTSGLPGGGANPPTGIAEQAKQEELNIFPNPASRFVNLDVPQNEMLLWVEVSDLAGKLQLRGHVSVLDVAGFPKGMYVLRVKTDARLYTKKLVITGQE